MEYKTLQQKLDCFLLTSRISKSLTKEFEAVGKRIYEDKLQDEILASILTIKGSEERILTRLDYWISGQLTNESECQVANLSSPTRHIHTASNDEARVLQNWHLDVEISNDRAKHRSPEQDTRVRKDIQLTRWSSFVSPAKNRWRNPWRAGRVLHQDNISMFAYTSKSRLEAEEDLPTGAILRKSMFSKFGTLNSKKMKMFFRKENNDQLDAKSKNSLKDGNQLDSTAVGQKSKSFFFKFRKKEKFDMNEGQDTSARDKSRRKHRRPKSVASCDFDLDDIIIPSSSTENIEGNLPVDIDDKSKTFRERLRTMPVFYVPISNKGPLKVFK